MTTSFRPIAITALPWRAEWTPKGGDGRTLREGHGMLARAWEGRCTSST